MGNSICFDCEEFYFKFAYITDKKAPEIYNVSKYVTWAELHTDAVDAYLGKILFTDISDHVSLKILSDKCLKNLASER